MLLVKQRFFVQKLHPPQILTIFLVATAGTLIAIQLCNVYQAVCFGVVLAIITYSVILTLEDKKPPIKRP